MTATPETALQKLWAPGPHVGWGFRDRRTHIVAFAELAPIPPPADAPVAVKPAGKGRVLLVAVLGGGATAVFGLCGVVASGPSGSTFGTTMLNTALLMLVGTAGLTGLLIWQRSRGADPGGRAHQEYVRQHAAWQQRWREHYAAEEHRVAALPEWGTVRPGPDNQRLNVIGGGLYGWEAFLTVAGTSYLATHGPAVVVDLTGEAVCRELVALCAVGRAGVDLQLLPADLDTSDLLEGLDLRQLVDVIVEAVHGDNLDSRPAKAIDSRILTAITDALPGLNMARLVAALRTLMGETSGLDAVTAGERERLRDLFSRDYLQANASALHRLEALLHPLRHLSGGPRPAATLTALALATDGTSVGSDLLADLIIAWLTRRIGATPNPARTVIIAGADQLPNRQISRLADICTRNRVGLVLMWRHLRAGALQAAGGGPVGFMRLPSYEEAAQAADHIGRETKFVLAGLTHTTGGSQTHTDGTTDTQTSGSGGSAGRSITGRLTDLVRHRGGWSTSEASSWNTSRTWGTTSSIAESTSWGDTTSTQRVVEHRVDPATLQGLPDYGMLLVQHHHGEVTITAVDCNPDLVNLPGTSMQPLPNLAATPTPAYGSGQQTPQPHPQPAVTQQPIPVQRTESWTRDQDRQW